MLNIDFHAQKRPKVIDEQEKKLTYRPLENFFLKVCSMLPCGPFLADLLHITGQCAKFLLACHWRETTLKVASTDVVEKEECVVDRFSCVQMLPSAKERISFILASAEQSVKELFGKSVPFLGQLNHEQKASRETKSLHRKHQKAFCFFVSFLNPYSLTVSFNQRVQ